MSDDEEEDEEFEEGEGEAEPLGNGAEHKERPAKRQKVAVEEEVDEPDAGIEEGDEGQEEEEEETEEVEETEEQGEEKEGGEEEGEEEEEEEEDDQGDQGDQVATNGVGKTAPTKGTVKATEMPAETTEAKAVAVNGDVEA
ncbi:hypothetical protein ACRALDRAFT_1081662 [Sodiomyces alcalophilus JCM 7366]|uniref:uncharacterized protein n=1 Tax=Sodiomyces alcalophilus JCM 7366 TaxID=591952 RepID=UPI0039B57BE8